MPVQATLAALPEVEHLSTQADPHGQYLVWLKVANAIIDRINNGTYRPNTRIPSEPALAAEFGCARETIRKATDALRDRRVVFTVLGKGSFVQARVAEASDRIAGRS
jgi:DNA-binding GntR family transcriptional regulator